SALSFDFDFAFNYKGYLSGLPALFSIPLHIDIFVDFDGALGREIARIVELCCKETSNGPSIQ
ncbi:MAG: hypothetical protein M0Q40_11890, partial [Limnochordia bacterium]|nr:hypothetical protein [Limnochordia bacterium]